MATDIGKYVSLKTVSSYFLDQYSKQGLYDLDQVWLLGLRALVAMHFQVIAEPKTLRLPVSGNKTVAYPSDCLSITKVGLLNENGEISSLKINNALTTFKAANPDRLERLSPDIIDGINNLSSAPIYLNYYYNDTYNNLFGTGNGLIQYGECTIDDKNKLIVLAPDFKYSSIMVEYLSSPERDDDYMVETILQEAIIAFIEWKLKLGTSQEFYARVTEARRGLSGKKVMLSEVNRVIREAQSMKLRS